MRFDSGAIGQWSEICAYGTGVWVSRSATYAKAQYDALVASRTAAASGHLPASRQRVDANETIPGEVAR